MKPQCHAVVDRLSPERGPLSEGAPMWRVIVWGEPPHAAERVYLLRANDDNGAAKEGLRRFEAEFTALPLRLLMGGRVLPVR